MTTKTIKRKEIKMTNKETMTRTIREGMHRPLGIIPAFLRNMRICRSKGRIIGYDFFINDTYEYLIGGGDQMDWNKMYGWSFGINHHQNSIRIVWRYNAKDDAVEFAPYAYIGGKRILPSDKQIVRGFIGGAISTSIEVLDDTAKVTICNGDVKNTTQFVFSGCEKKPLLGLWIYFGGNRTAPHDIKIQYAKESAISTLMRF